MNVGVRGERVSDRMRSCARLMDDPQSSAIVNRFAGEVSRLEYDFDYLGKSVRAAFTRVFVPDVDFDIDLFSKRLNLALEQRGVTENYACWCKQHGISPTGLYGFMKGKGAPQLATFFTLCRELDVDPAWLMGLASYSDSWKGSHDG